jgi:hypothetical protein
MAQMLLGSALLLLRGTVYTWGALIIVFSSE